MPPSGIVHIYQLDDDQTITLVRPLEAGLSGKSGDRIARFSVIAPIHCTLLVQLYGGKS